MLIASNCAELEEVYFCAPFGMLLGRIVFKKGLLVDPTKIALILSLPLPTNVKQLRVTLGHTGYYRKFIYGYVEITAPMERLLKKDAVFVWSQECRDSFEMLNAMMDSAPILVFPDWNKEFHVHVDASSIALGVVLTQIGEGDLDHSITLSSRKLSSMEKIILNREGRSGNGICGTKVLELHIGKSF